MSYLANNIGSGRSNHHQLCPFGNSNMLHLKLEIPVKGIHQTFVSGQGFKGHGLNEAGSILCHQHMYIGLQFL